MQPLPDFRLEVFFSRWEFAARYHLTASDAETLSLRELLAMADDEMLERWNALRLSYTQTYGMPELRAAIAQTYDNLEADDVLCFAGAEEGLYVAMQAMLHAGDHAIVVTPNYQAAESVPLSICEVTGIALDQNNDWTLDIDAVTRAIRRNTRMISVNFPNNPTGAVPEPDTWQRLVTLCEEHAITLFSDEVYRGLELPPNKPLPQAADMSKSALSLNVMSKAYGLPGLRVGWIACQNRDRLRRMERIKHYTTICNAAPSELLALIALRSREKILDRNRSIVAQNVEACNAFFAAHAELFDWKPPQGGCVSFPAYRGPDGVEEMCETLIREEGILLLPSSIYLSQLAATPQGRFRIGVGRDPVTTREALTRWSAWLASRRGETRVSAS